MVIIIFFFCFFCLLFIGFVLVMISSNKREGKWGINTDGVSCPKCAVVLPRIRKPANIRQTLWGGWTCNNCGCEVDKWGKEIIIQK
jgi:hypothetical protein